eukprot:CAMPEP_0172304246 /NCGR_PEP_ID=MMETSP1058-20130122/5675_1 /TAXON_ID=83371 /ORGANISM="Detonula confervacea, Strain CCMP 353" /LENGTH=225 /DNA_ID=CAMNT_0013015387 /DNA_START=275 /DNA_END=952 /DNA_ORIENTATION=+
MIDLEPHYISQSMLAWLQKMADSYKLERGEDLLDVILRESSNEPTNNSNDDPKTTHLLQLATTCAKTNLPMASHDFLRDPSGEAIYNYGNMAFLDGFGYEWEEFIRLPSRKCVEKGEVEERQKLLDAVKANAMKSDDDAAAAAAADNDNNKDGNDDDDLASKYDNLIRVRRDGRKILLKGVNLWNVYDICLEDMESPDFVRARIEKGEIKAIGQAVWIRHVEYLD